MAISAARDFGVQSYCFRNFKDNAKVAELTKKIGVKKIELCAIHVDFDDVDSFKRELEIYRKAGVEVVSIGVQTFVGDISRERKWFECAKAAGAKHISAHFTVSTFHEAVARAARLCEEFDIRIGIHCHGGYMFGGADETGRPAHRDQPGYSLVHADRAQWRSDQVGAREVQGEDFRRALQGFCV
jgi:sugar phosphate isomerase/epimerase